MEVAINSTELTRSRPTSADAAAAGQEADEAVRESGRSWDRSQTTEVVTVSQHPSAEASGEESGVKENDGKDDSLQAKKKRCRRKRKAGDHHRVHRWKPYAEMTWEEKQQQEEQEALRANQKRDKRFASGQPMAPYNTTQFLMEQHDGDDLTGEGGGGGENSYTESDRPSDDALPMSPGYVVKTRRPSGGDHSVSGEDDSMSDNTPCDDWSGFEDSYLQRDFIKAYENYRAERLQGMTKDELVRECLIMEAKLECIQGKLSETLESRNGQLVRLREENERLVKENEQLRSANVIEKLVTECIG